MDINFFHKEIKRQGDANKAGLNELHPEKNYKSAGTLQVADKNFLLCLIYIFLNLKFQSFSH